MPNWVHNKITADDFQLLKEKFTRVDDKGHRFVDFNLVLPLSDDLHITAGSFSWKTKEGLFDKETFEKQEAVLRPLLEAVYDDTISQEDFTRKAIIHVPSEKFIDVYNMASKQNVTDEKYIKEGIENIVKGFFNLKRHGYTDWYEAQNSVWGTKWNACDSVVDEETETITFDTAWSCPFEVLEELSKVVNITVSFADEDLGNNYGIIEFNNGIPKDLLDGNNHNIGEAMALRGYSIEGIDDYFSEENYSDEEIKEYFDCNNREELIEKIKKAYNDTRNLSFLKI